MLCMIEILVTEEDDLPLQEGIAHCLQLFGRERLAEIHAADLRTDMQGQRNDFDRLRAVAARHRLTRRDHLPSSSIVWLPDRDPRRRGCQFRPPDVLRTNPWT